MTSPSRPEVVRSSTSSAFFVLVVTLICAVGRLPVVSGRNVDSQLDPGLVPLYAMTNIWLEDIIQSRFLTSMESEVKMETLTDFTNSFSSDWDKWIVYVIGFTVCAALGLVIFVVMLMTGLLFPFCRCCGNCGARDPQYSGRKRTSKCCTVAREVILAAITLTLLFVNVTMYCTNERFVQQLKVGVFKDLDTGFQEVDVFLQKTVNDMDSVIYDEYVTLETTVVTTLDGLPSEVMTLLDNATGAVTTLDQLAAFAANLDELNTTLISADQLADKLETLTAELWTNFTLVQADIVDELIKCNPPCEAAIILVNATHISVNFSVVQLTAAHQAVEVAIISDLEGLVNDSQKQLDNVEQTVNDSMAPTTADIKQSCKEAEDQLASMVDDLNSTVSQLNIANLRETIASGQDLISPWVDLAYYIIIGLCAVLSIVVAMNILGLIFGLVLPPRRVTPSSKDTCSCSRDKSVGSHFLMTSAALTFIFYWLYILLVCVLFVVGGLVQTEACRHVVSYDVQQSSDVLDIFDRWINESVAATSGVDVMLFDIYSQCVSSNVTIYTAMNLEKYYNLTELTNTEELEKAIEDLKAMNISIPPVNLTNPALNSILFQLDVALGPQSLNFTYMYANINGSITDPDLRDLVQTLSDTANTNGINLDNQISDLQYLINNSLKAIETGRDQLIQLLSDAQRMIAGINFTAAALTLENSQEVINSDGDVIVQKYINDTADKIYADVTAYMDKAVYAIESEIGRCRPLYDSMTLMIDTTCVKTVYPINGFWFALGWCLAFLIPGLILAIQLASIFWYTSTPNSVAHVDPVDDLNAIEYVKSGNDGQDFQAKPAPSEDIPQYPAPDYFEFDDVTGGKPTAPPTAENQDSNG